MLKIILDEFHYSTLWNGGILIYIGFIFIIYFLLLPQDKKYPIWKQLAFVLGMVAVFAALGSPVNVIGRIKFSIHILQLILLLLVAPPLLIIGFKNEIFLRAKEIKVLEKLLKFSSMPFVGFIAFFALFYWFHVPSVFNHARLDLFINYLYMLVLLIAGILLWLPIISPNALTKLGKRVYILFCSMFLIPYGLILLFHNQSLYLVYTDVGMFMQSLAVCIPNVKEIPSAMAAALLPFNPVEEQFQGGIMLVASQIIIFGIALFLAPKYSKQA